MQVNFRLLSVLALSIAIGFTACKKDQSKDNNSKDVASQTDEQNRVSEDMDDISNDVNVAVESSGSFSGGRMSDINDVCGATITLDTVSNPRKITVTYAGLDCSGTHTRNGVVVISMAAGTRWKNAGAVLTVDVQNLNVKRLSDNKSITINGTHTYTNVSGGLWYQLPNLTNIVHTLTSNNMSVKFDDNTVSHWNIAKKTTYTYQNGIVAAVEGFHTEGTNTKIAEWGTTRFAQSFTTTINEPLVVRQDCSFRVTGGQVTYSGFIDASVTFGLDATGTPTSCPGTGHYYYKVIWTGPNGTSLTVIAPY